MLFDLFVELHMFGVNDCSEPLNAPIPSVLIAVLVVIGRLSHEKIGLLELIACLDSTA